MSVKFDLNDVLHAQETCLTIRGSRRRTTVPGEIIDFFKLQDKDSVRWVLLKDGTVAIIPVKKENKEDSK